MSARQNELSQSRPPSAGVNSSRSWSAQGNTTDRGQAPRGFGSSNSPANNSNTVARANNRPPWAGSGAQTNGGANAGGRSYTPQGNVASNNRNYSAPSRSNPAPTRSYSAPSRTYSAPSRTYSAPSRSYGGGSAPRASSGGGASHSSGGSAPHGGGGGTAHSGGGGGGGGGSHPHR
jgi:hypothetical protein